MPALMDVFSAALAAVDVGAASRREAVEALVALVAAAGKVRDPAALVEAVMEREALAPTGLGEDCAIPHAQTDAVAETVVAAARLSAPVDFGAPDGTPARLVFLIVGPKDSAAVHLRLLSKLARIMSDPDFRAQALAAPDGRSLVDCVLSAGQA